jgi:hypothetical protein
VGEQKWETVFKIEPKGCNMELYSPNDCIPNGYEIRGGAKVGGGYEENDVSHQDCIKECNGTKECHYFTWYSDTKRCHLKAEIPYFCTRVKNRISGQKDSPQCNPTTAKTTTSTTTTTTTGDDTTVTTEISDAEQSGNVNTKETMVVAMVVSAVVFLVIGALCFLYIKQKKKTDNNNPLESVLYNVEEEANTKVSTATFVDQVTSGAIPLTDEYSMLNNLDTRMHVLVFTSHEGVAHGLLNRFKNLKTELKILPDLTHEPCTYGRRGFKGLGGTIVESRRDIPYGTINLQKFAHFEQGK